MSAAGAIYEETHGHAEYAISNPDEKIISWTSMEYTLFRTLEYERVGGYALIAVNCFDMEEN